MKNTQTDYQFFIPCTSVSVSYIKNRNGGIIMTKSKVQLQQEEPKEWIYYNGQMNDAAYSRAFSLGVDAIMKTIGINEDTIKQNHYTIYTLETHIVYLDEMKLGETFEVHMSLLDSDSKRLHVFFEL